MHGGLEMDRLWWNKIPNAVRLTESIIDILVEGRSVLLSLPKYIPWYNTFRDQVEDVQRQNLGGYGIDFLEDSDDLEPGYFLFMEYCKKELRDDYRPAIGYARFLADAESIPLNNTIVWIKLKNEKRLKEWCDFVSKYYKELKDDFGGGLFIIETSIDISGISFKGGRIVKYEDYIGEFDYYIYCTLASSVLKTVKYKKEYLAEIVTSILGNDMELAALCLTNERFMSFWNNPVNTIESIVSEQSRSDGEIFSFKLNEEEIKQRMWRAQIKNLFPVIESYRGDFVSRNLESIDRMLPISSSNGEQFTRPYDVEIGTLYYMVCNRDIELSTEEYKRLKCFKEARNKLAHLDVLSVREIEELFELMN